MSVIDTVIAADDGYTMVMESYVLVPAGILLAQSILRENILFTQS